MLMNGEQWPDPDDVAEWLTALEAGIVLLDEQRADAIANLAHCRAAVEATRSAPSVEASQRVCLLMNGEVFEPSELPDEAPLSVASTWNPPTKQERQARRLSAEDRARVKSLDEKRRRIALAEKRTGVPFEGLPIEELCPSIKARLEARRGERR